MSAARKLASATHLYLVTDDPGHGGSDGPRTDPILAALAFALVARDVWPDADVPAIARSLLRGMGAAAVIPQLDALVPQLRQIIAGMDPPNVET